MKFLQEINQSHLLWLLMNISQVWRLLASGQRSWYSWWWRAGRGASKGLLAILVDVKTVVRFVARFVATVWHFVDTCARRWRTLLLLIIFHVTSQQSDALRKRCSFLLKTLYCKTSFRVKLAARWLRANRRSRIKFVRILKKFHSIKT